MTDEVARARNRRLNAEAPEIKAPRPRVPKPRKPKRLIATASITHALQELRGRIWLTVHDGSEADCAAQLERAARHWQDKVFRVVTQEEVAAERRRKTWSVNDADHVPNGSRVMLAAAPEQLHPSLAKARAAFGLPRTDGRIGVILRRERRSGSYLVRIDGTGLAVGVARSDFYFPVPDVVPLRAKR